jgi:hypothetical protein
MDILTCIFAGIMFLIGSVALYGAISEDDPFLLFLTQKKLYRLS